MATAEELLAGMSTGDDTTLIIDNYLRTIKIPKSITNLGVEHDDEVLTLNFKMPRYLDDTDLSDFAIRINYINANGDSDAYTVNDNKKLVTSSHILFSWLVGPTATAYKGETRFIVCMKTLNSNGYIDREYNTTIASLPVLEGLEVDPDVVLRYSDIIEQWRQELFGTEQSLLNTINAAREKAELFIEMKGEEVLATIPEEYQVTADAAQEGIRTKADAIVATAEGTAITVSDSSDDNVRSLRVFGKTTQTVTTGKNLLPNDIKSYGSRNGITFEDLGEDKIKVTGTATSNTTYVYCPFDVGTRTPISAGTYTVSGNPGKNVYLSFFLYESQETTDILMSNASMCDGKTWTFTIDQDAYYGAYLFIGEGKTVSKAIIAAQLEIGSEATEYEPYSGGFASPSQYWPQALTNIENPAVHIHGKNLLSVDHDIGTKTIMGIEYTINEDKSITANGTATGASYFVVNDTNNIALYAGQEYTLTGCPTGGDASTGYHMYIESMSIRDVGDGVTFKPTSDIHTRVVIFIRTGTEVTNLTFYPMIRHSSTPAGYEPHVERVVETDYTLPGIPVDSGGNYTDADGQSWFCDEIDFERRVYIQRIGSITLDGSADERWFATESLYYISIPDKRSNRVAMPNALRCTHFKVPQTVSYSLGYLTETYYHSGNTNILINFDDGSGGVDNFVTWLQSNSITVQYVLATQIETPLTEEEIEWFRSAHTNYPNTVVLNNSGAHMELVYNVDTKTYVDNGIQKTVSEVMEAIANGSY